MLVQATITELDCDTSSVGMLSRPDLHGSVVTSLRDLIVSGVLRPGARLDEPALCRTLGLSRTPLREAVKVLASEQLLTIVPHRGTYVAPVLEAETAEIFELMASLDILVGVRLAHHATPGEIAAIAASHAEMASHHAACSQILYFQANQQIHEALLHATHMPTLVRVYLPLLRKIRRARGLANVSFDRQTQSLAEHADILAALIARDEVRLVQLLPAHTRMTAQAVLAAMAGDA
jgi:DNA-binding GntR family transcriptional regulator